ncbi:MAG: FIST C-terminal domain-containing protein, partial [Defluviitaleaceae bacterium]|nr:FIST C-terminal domain-containing protein [Defluviitaleaceae bacterium]
MTKTFVITTAEIDNEERAVQEMMTQVNKHKLLKNSTGVISCHYEFVLSGVAKAVCEALPFEVSGIVAAPLSDGMRVDSLLLSIMVITSNDAEFVHIVSESLFGDKKAAVAQEYEKATKGRNEKPKLILTFAPFIPTNLGDEYTTILSELSGGAPCFGSLAIDDNPDFSQCFTISNGEHLKDKMVLTLIYGNINPKFYIANVSSDKISDRAALITKSQGHIVQEVNGRSMDEYFDSLGLLEIIDTQYAMIMMPFLLDYKDGTPMVSKIFINVTPERHSLFASEMPEGSELYIAQCDRNDIFKTTGETIDGILKDLEYAAGALMYSCIGRMLSLDSEQYSEMELVSE